jgi:hypothetical protein
MRMSPHFWNSSKSVTKVLVLTTSAQVAPAALRHRSRFWNVCSICARMSATGKPANCQSCPARQSDAGGNGRGGKTDRQRKSDDTREFSRSEGLQDISQRNDLNP